MTAPSTFAFSLACGTAGAWVNVTADVLFEEGPIPFTDGRTSQFDGFSPGTFSFTLKNGDGKYTPDNTASTLAVPLSEGMGATIELAGLLLSGTIRNVAVVFPPFGKSDTARVRVTCDDMLGNAARNVITDDLADALFDASGGIALWLLDEPAGSSAAKETYGRFPNMHIAGSPVTFGTTTPAIDAAAVVAIGAGGGLVADDTFSTLSDTVYPGAWNFWFMQAEGSAVSCGFAFLTSAGIIGVTVGITAGNITLGNFAGVVTGPSISAGVGYFVSADVTAAFVAGSWEFTYELWVDGVSYGTVTFAPGGVASLSPYRYFNVVLLASTGTVYYSRLTHSDVPINETAIPSATAAERLPTLAATTPEITLDTIPTLSPAILGRQNTAGQSALDALNDVMRAEQGYMWVETTGTLLAPVPKIKVAARDRERAIDYTFAVSEILDPIPFIRSLANTVSQFTATGSDTSATYQDADLIPLVGSASSSDTTPLRDFIDLYGYASDRVVRGEAHGVTIQSITIDATSPDINRWADLTAIRQGYRLHITGLPETQVGYDTWDGFVVGREIINTQDSQTDEPKSLFTFYLSPWSRVPVFDTDVFAAGDVLTLSSNINSSVTTMNIATSDTLTKFTTSGLPLDVVMGTERMTVSVVTSATPQVFTMARGIGGTIAVAHTAGETLELYDPARYAF